MATTDEQAAPGIQITTAAELAERFKPEPKVLAPRDISPLRVWRGVTPDAAITPDDEKFAGAYVQRIADLVNNRDLSAEKRAADRQAATEAAKAEARQREEQDLANSLRGVDQELARFVAEQAPKPLTFSLGETEGEKQRKIQLAALDATRATERHAAVAEAIAFVPHASVEERVAMLADEELLGDRASVRLVSVLVSSLEKELRDTPEHKRQGSNLPALVSKARGTLDKLRKANLSPSQRKAELEKRKALIEMDIRSKHQHLRRVMGLEGQHQSTLGAYR